MRKKVEKPATAAKVPLLRSRKFRLAAAVTALAVVIAAGCGIGYAIHKNVRVKPEEMQTVNLATHREGTLRVGIISDTQLPPTAKLEKENGGKYKENLKRALELLKTQNIDVLLHVGDVGDMCSKYAYETYREVFASVFSDEATRPYELAIMGNHDTWFNSDWETTPAKQKLFQRVIGTNPNRHVVINGFHFICASPDETGNQDGYSQTMRGWIRQELAAAKEQTPEGYPIFLITHHNVPDTAYGSSDWGAEYVRQAVDGYDQVVSISGHSHYSILDERSIDQNRITAFTTQSLAYIDMERNMYNAFNGFRYDSKAKKTVFDPSSCYSSAPAMEESAPMCLIMDVTSKDTTVQRWNVLAGKEEKADQRWTLTYPMDPGNFTYRYADRAAAAGVPEFTQDARLTFNPAISSYEQMADGSTPTLQGVTFPAATVTNSTVNSYTLKLKNKTTGLEYTYTTYSDYYLGADRHSDTVSLPFDPTLPSGMYRATVYANESFGNRSRALTLDNINYVQPDLEIAD